MSTPTPGNPANPNSADDLLRTLLDGSLTPTDEATLLRSAASDPALLADYLALTEIHAILAYESRPTSTQAGGASAPPAHAQPTTPESFPIYRKGHEPKPALSPAKVRIITALAAALLAACGLTAYFLVFTNPQSEIPDPSATAPLATLIDASEGASLTTPSGYTTTGRDYPRGAYALSGSDRATAEFMLTNAVNVTLRGDTRMVLHHEMNVALAHGNAAFHCPPGTEGFTVHLPSGVRVVDLGTRFTIRVDDAGRARVRVLEGRVKLERDGVDLATLDARHTIAVDPAGAVGDVAEVAPDLRIIDGLVLAYTFETDDPDNDTVDNAAPDAESADGERTGGELVPGRRPGTTALRFDGVDDRIEFNLPESLDSFTLSAWVRLESSTDKLASLVTFDHDGQRPTRWMYANDGGGVRLVSSAFEVRRTLGVPVGEYVHLAAVVDRDAHRITLYHNGRPVHTAEITGDDPLVGGRCLVGHFGGTAFPRWLRGDLDELLIYDRALSEGEIARLADTDSDTNEE